MSNARSPREVCSTTIGIRGLMRSLLAGWGPQFLLGRRAILLRSPDALTRRFLLCALGRLLLGDRLDLGDDPVERLAQADALADAVGAALGEELVNVGLLLACAEQLGADLLVGHVQPELVGDRLE